MARLASRSAKSTDAVLKTLREHGLTYPGSHLKSPWPGHLDLAVNDKTFAYLSIEGEPFRISCKLPQSCAAALLLPFAKPTAYGLGKSGWVSAEFPPGQAPPFELLKAWIDESYRAQAPKRLVTLLDRGESGAPGGRERSVAGSSSLKRTKGKSSQKRDGSSAELPRRSAASAPRMGRKR